MNSSNSNTPKDNSTVKVPDTGIAEETLINLAEGIRNNQNNKSF